MISIVNEMLSIVPIQLEKINKEDTDREILRAAIIGELDAINLYEQKKEISKPEEM